MLLERSQFLGANPTQLGDTGIGRKTSAVERDTEFWGLADRLCPGIAETNMPRLLINRRRTREGAAGKEREIHSLARIANGFIANDLDLGRARGLRKRLAVAIVGYVHPPHPVGDVFALGEVDRFLGGVFG